MNRIALILKSNKIEAKEAIKMAKKFLLTKNYKIYTKINKSPLPRLSWIMVFGGDGAVLNIANMVAAHNIPLIGINFGHRGYLCEINPSEPDALLNGLKRLIKKQFSIRPCTRIQAKIINKNKIKKQADGLNEIVVGGNNRTAYLKIKVKLGKNTKAAHLVGDGVIFSTRVGSTAYNLYAGGPVLLNNNFSVTMINALIDSQYFLPNTQSFVTPIEASFEVISERNGKFLPYVVVDGQIDYRLKNGDVVIVNRSKLITKLIELKK